MSVKFYPSNPIDALESIILKEDGTPLYGEINIYRKLSKELGKSEMEWHIWHDLKLPEHSDNYNYYKKTSAQIDFLILCEYGILVLEIKGGPISTKDNAFYYGKNFNTPMSQNPFKQAEGYKYTLKDNILNNFKNSFFCEAVALPHVDYPFESKVIDSNLLWTEHNASTYNNSIEKFLVSVFEYSKKKHKKHFRNYSNLSPKDCANVKKILSPIIGDRNTYESTNTLEWLKVQNIEILEGLYKNQRILIEGPPGSGKTTLAKAYIDKQFNKKGIYLCWNNLLMRHTESLLKDRRLIDKVEVTTYFRFFQKLNPQLTYHQISSLSENEFYALVKETISRLQREDKLVSYDYIVIDEAQDLLDRGLDLFINSFSGFNRKGLENGNSLILYDIDQSYTSSGRDIAILADLISDYYSHFRLSEVKRSAQNPDIRKLSSDLFDDHTTISLHAFKDLYPSISVIRHNNLMDLKKHIIKNILTPIRQSDSSLIGNDCVILIESTFLKGSFDGDEDLSELLIIKDIEELTGDNIGNIANKLRYTSILKYKGLEKKNVFLVISEPTLFNKYEAFVGITRAMLNLEINIVR